MAVLTEFQKETMLTMKKTAKDQENEKSMKSGSEDEVESLYEDIEFDDGSEIDYGLDYTLSQWKIKIQLVKSPLRLNIKGH